jgi:hypothetical protein
MSGTSHWLRGVRRVFKRGVNEAAADQPDRQGLFVIGAARSGTTVLQNALNDSPHIFLLGEPAFHDAPGSAEFAARYNAMHRAWGHQENKSSFCPPLLAGDGNWRDYLERLARLYRYVGSKIVINPAGATETCRRVFDFHCRYFYRSHYVFAFRNPVDVLVSTRGLAELHGDQPASHASLLRSFLAVMALYLRMLRNLPSVTAIFHESVDEPTFAMLGQRLGVDLSGALRYYDGARVRRYTLDAFPHDVRDVVAAVADLYERFRRAAGTGFELIQLEQNSGHLEQRHFTPLGELHRQIERMSAAI